MQEDLFSMWLSTCSSKSETIVNNAHCYKSRDYKHGDRLWKLPWAKRVLLKVVANINALV